MQHLDLVTSNLGGIEFSSEPPTRTAARIRLERRDVRLSPGASATVRFAIDVADGVAAVSTTPAWSPSTAASYVASPPSVPPINAASS